MRYRHGKIPHTAVVSKIQPYYTMVSHQLGKAGSPHMQCKQMVCLTTEKGRRAKGKSAAGWADSTGEAVEIQWREAEEGLYPHSLPMQGNIKEETLSIDRDWEIMTTKLERLLQLSRENPDMVFTSVGHLISKEMLKGCHARMDGGKAVGIDGITKED